MLHLDLETSGQDPGHLLIVVEEVQDTQRALHQEATAAVVMTMMTSTDVREGELLVRILHVIIHLMATTDHQGPHEGPGADAAAQPADPDVGGGVRGEEEAEETASELESELRWEEKERGAMKQTKT